MSYKLETIAGRKVVFDHLFDSYGNHTDFDSYLKSGIPVVTYKNWVVTFDDIDANAVVINSNGLIHTAFSDTECEGIRREWDKTKISDIDPDPVGVILPNPIKGCDTALGVIYNGDEANNFLVGASDFEAPTISFECLTRFFVKTDDAPDCNKLVEVVKRLGKGTIEVVDYTPSTTIEFTTSEKQQQKVYNTYLTKIKEGKVVKNKVSPLKPPERGFVAVCQSWHRTSSVLLYCYKENFTILMGVDEDSYFGCQLIDNPKTISDAYLSLIPKALQKHSERILLLFAKVNGS